MEKVKSKSFFWIWSFTGLCVSILIWNLPWRFQVNDDEIMMWLVSGAYTGTPESYAVFIHPLLSWVFSKLYTVAPNIPWYPLTWFLLIYLGYVILLKVIDQKFPSILAKIIWCLFVFGLFIHFLFFLQFSIVSAFSLIAGLAFRWELYNQSKYPWYKIYPSDILILMGVLIRYEVAFLCIVGIFLLNIIVLRERQIYSMLLIPILFFLLAFSFQLYSVDSDFRKLNKLRSEVFDHPVSQLHKEEFKESVPDLYNFSNGLIDFQKDQELSGKLKIWKEYLDEKRMEHLDFSSYQLALNFYMDQNVYLISIIALFLLFSWKWKINKQLILGAILAAIILILTPIYLIKVQIYVLVFLVYFLATWINTPSDFGSPKLNFGLSVILTLGILYHFYSFTQSNENSPPSKNLKTQISKLKEEGVDQVVLIGSGEIYHDLIFENPLPFKVLGWPTLLNRNDPIPKNRAYLVDSVTFSKNSSYFKKERQVPSLCDQILLIPREWK